MQNLRVNLENYKLTVVEPPAPKFKRDDNDQVVAAVDRSGVQVFSVSLFAKMVPAAGEYVQKGEEITVTLATDPGAGFDEGQRVVLVDPTVSPYRMEKNGKVNAGISFKALGLTHVNVPAPRPNKD